MTLHLSEQFDAATLERGRDYVRRGLVVSVETLPDGTLRGGVANERGRLYQQKIATLRDRVDGICTCPVGYNCKHVAATLLFQEADKRHAPGLAAPLCQIPAARIRTISRTCRMAVLSAGIGLSFGKPRSDPKQASRTLPKPGRLHPGTVGDFKSERWATSFRNRGRHRSEFADPCPRRHLHKPSCRNGEAGGVCARSSRCSNPLFELPFLVRSHVEVGILTI